MISIRGGSGLGDAIYLQSIARHFVEKGHRVEACTAWGDVFRPLGDKVKVSPFRRNAIDRCAHYAARRGVKGTTQWQDCCLEAGIQEPVDLRLNWRRPAPPPIGNGLPLVLVQMPRPPFARTDGYGMEFLPRCEVIQRAIDTLQGRVFLVQIGSGEPLYRYRGLDLDLANRTTVPELLDVAVAADAMLGQCSFMVPLAESFNVEALFVWARAAEQSRHEPVRQMTPHKILHKPTSRAIFDDCGDRELTEAINALCDRIRRARAA